MAYSSSNTYAVYDDLKKRLSRPGMLQLIDVDSRDQEASAAEKEYAEDALEWANTTIDSYICDLIDSVTARPSNEWLRQRCVDIACYRLATLGGRGGNESLRLSYEMALNDLKLVQQGAMKIPGLEVTSPAVDDRFVGVPRVINAGGGTWHRG